VLFEYAGKQTSDSFNDYAEAVEFRDMVNNPHIGPARARDIWRRRLEGVGDWTVEAWITHYIDHLTGVQKSTIYDYGTYLRKNIAPTLGPIPLVALEADDLSECRDQTIEPRISLHGPTTQLVIQSP
jgi:hypothetical protein